MLNFIHHTSRTPLAQKTESLRGCTVHGTDPGAAGVAHGRRAGVATLAFRLLTLAAYHNFGANTGIFPRGAVRQVARGSELQRSGLTTRSCEPDVRRGYAYRV